MRRHGETMGAAVNMTPYERRMRASRAGLARSAQEDGGEIARPAHRGYWTAREREVEQVAPGLRERDPQEFARRVRLASKAHMKSLSLKAAATKRERATLPPVSEEPNDREVAAETRAEARKLNKPGSPEAKLLREKMAALEAKQEAVDALFRALMLREIAERADELTDLAMRSLTTDMRPTPDPSDLAA